MSIRPTDDASHGIAPGITQLLEHRRDIVAGRRVALVTHAATLDSNGRQTADLLHACPDVRLVSVMAPEHGYFGAAGAGEPCRDTRHPAWREIPIHSLYGEQRKPTRAMLRDCDTVVFDLQDLGYRHYTYVSTLRLVMEACAEQDKRLVVCDRPVPLPSVVDGPMLDPRFASFVAAIPAPMVYGMTPAESALWLRDALELALEIDAIPMSCRSRVPLSRAHGIPYAAPSPSIVSPESAMTYPALVFTEAFPHLHHGQHTAWPFQVLARRALDAERLAELLETENLPGVRIHPHWYMAAVSPAPRRPAPLAGIRLCVTDPARFHPATTAVTIVAALQRLYGTRALWKAPGARPAFFDLLFGTDTVRLALQQGASPDEIAAPWRHAAAAFRRARRRHLLYTP